jgi:YidC/Oxa1 family membrane protein insertase
MDENNRNMLLAIVLSGLVLIAWHFLYAGPKMKEEQERQKRIAQHQGQQQTGGPAVPGVSPGPQSPAGAPPVPGAAPAAGAPRQGVTAPVPAATREAVVQATPRVPIETSTLLGSIALKGGRIDDIVLAKYRQTTKPDSKQVTLFSPSGAPEPFYAEFGWNAPAGSSAKVPGPDAVWTLESGQKLTTQTPVTLRHDNGEGLIFRRTIAIDDAYMFSVRDEVENTSSGDVTLFPYALISRHYRPTIEGFYIQHEGLIGVIGAEGLQEITYDKAIEFGAPGKTFRKEAGGWLGITDKYWAAALIPNQKDGYAGRVWGEKSGARERFQTDYMLDPVVVPKGGRQAVEGRLFAGAKNVKQIQKYANTLGIKKFDLLIDWGWFYFITKPLFYVLDFFGHALGNFGLAILATTVLVKLIFFPLANKSYASMSKMKLVQPELERIRERYKDDKARLQQAMMELYQKEKINPMAGCLPVLLQIPVFFALYKVLFTTIEMRHAPFYGWIKDLSAADPTNIFNLFGLIPITIPDTIPFLHLGIWPILMGLTMWVQMKLNPAPPDPVQAKIFAWMPVLFTFMLGTFAAGLVIYWTWNNLLSILQQYVIMRKQGVEIPLMKNLGLDRFFPDKKASKPAE